MKGYVIKDVDNCDYYDAECEDFSTDIRRSSIYKLKCQATKQVDFMLLHWNHNHDWLLAVVPVVYTPFRAREVRK